MSTQEKADAFFNDFQALLEKHFSGLDKSEAAPFAARFSERVPIVKAGLAGTTATVSATISWPPDTDSDPPD